MLENVRNRIIMICGVLIVSIYFLLPTYQFYFNSHDDIDHGTLKELENKALSFSRKRGL